MYVYSKASSGRADFDSLSVSILQESRSENTSYLHQEQNTIDKMKMNAPKTLIK